MKYNVQGGDAPMYKKRKLLLIGDNTMSAWHPLEPARMQLEAILSKEFELSVTDDYDDLSDLPQLDYDAVISYTDCWQRNLESQQILGLLHFVKRGGGLLAIHNGISLQTSDALAYMIGGRFTSHPPYQLLTYKRTSTEHVLLNGVDTFTVEESPIGLNLLPFHREMCFSSMNFRATAIPPPGSILMRPAKWSTCSRVTVQTPSYRRRIVH